MLTSWKTTLIGLGIGCGNLFLSALATGIKPKDALISVGITVLGALSKDHNVTGQ